MAKESKIFPIGFEWDEERGLIYDNGRKMCVVSNAFPEVMNRFEVSDKVTGDRYFETVTRFHYISGRESDPISITDSELKSGKFVNKFPPEFIVRPEMERKIAGIVRFLIKSQFSEVKPEKRDKLKIGWNDTADGPLYFWGDEDDLKLADASLYKSVCMMSMIIRKAPIAIGLILAGLHGVLKKMLEAAGVTHDFVTFIVGNTNVGKTSVASKFIPELNTSANIISLNSDIREIKKKLAGNPDMTILIDDLNSTCAKGLRDKNVQHASEIIYGSSDAGDMLISGSKIKIAGCKPHVVMTAEQIIRTPSTLNRCFLIRMDRPLDESTWNNVSEFARIKGFENILRAFIRWCVSRYDEVVEQMRIDFKVYLAEARKEIYYNEMILLRVQNTVAVQLVIWKCFFNFLERLNLDQMLLAKVNVLAKNYVLNSGEELTKDLYFLQTKKVYREHVDELAEMVLGLGGKYCMAKTEDQYLKRGVSPRKNGQICLGVCLVDGYLSYRADWLCSLLADREGREAVSPIALAKELKYHGLAHLDEAGEKVSCTWHSYRKMHHVNVRELLELVYPEDMYDLCRYEIIKKFENSDEHAQW